MVINAAANRQKNVLMTITSLSGHAQLMVLVFLPGRVCVTYLQFYTSKDSLVPRAFPLQN